MPGRVLLLAHDGCRPQGCAPAFAADAQRIGEHLAGILIRLRREVIQSHFCQIDHDTLAWRIRQNELPGNGDLRSLAGQPRVDIGIGQLQLAVADIKVPTEGDKRVLLIGLYMYDLADDVVAVRWQIVDCGRCKATEKKQYCKQYESRYHDVS